MNYVNPLASATIILTDEERERESSFKQSPANYTIYFIDQSNFSYVLIPASSYKWYPTSFQTKQDF